MKSFNRFLNSYFLPQWRKISFILTVIFIENLFVLINPLIIQKIVDDALIVFNRNYLFFLCLTGVVINVFLSLFSLYKTYLLTGFGNETFYKFRIDFYAHLQKLSLSFFHQTKTGDILNRLGKEITNIGNLLTGQFIGLLTNLLSFLIIAGMLMIYNWKLALLSFLVIPIYAIISKSIGKKLRTHDSKNEKTSSEIASFIIEKLSGMRLIKEMTAQQRLMKEYDQLTGKYQHGQYKSEFIYNMSIRATDMITYLGPMLVLFFGAYLVQNKSMTPGEVLAFYYFIVKLYTPVNALIDDGLSLQRARVSIDRVYEYLDIEPDVTERANPIELKQFKDSIKLENVSFNYDKRESVLISLYLEIKANTTIGIVGKSGCGKFTLAALLFRFYDVKAGTIKIDGTDIRELSTKSLRQKIGIVSQDSVCFNDTIISNLQIANENATLEDMQSACKIANIHDFIESLPEKYHTIVGENGSKLSGGEKQRLAIARVLIKNPEIIIFDEATSHLDNINEKLIQNAITEIAKSKTVIIIAHRLSTLMHADQIVVLDNGKIVENGTHEELLAGNGIYAELYLAK